MAEAATSLADHSNFKKMRGEGWTGQVIEDAHRKTSNRRGAHTRP